MIVLNIGHWVRVTGPKGQLVKEFTDNVSIKNHVEKGILPKQQLTSIEKDIY